MPERFTKRIIKLMTRPNYQPLKKTALAKALGIMEKDRHKFREAVELLRQEGKVIIGGQNRIMLPAISGRVTGIYRATSKGFGFVRPATFTRAS